MYNINAADIGEVCLYPRLYLSHIYDKNAPTTGSVFCRKFRYNPPTTNGDIKKGMMS